MFWRKNFLWFCILRLWCNWVFIVASPHGNARECLVCNYDYLYFRSFPYAEWTQNIFAIFSIGNFCQFLPPVRVLQSPSSAHSLYPFSRVGKMTLCVAVCKFSKRVWKMNISKLNSSVNSIHQKKKKKQRQTREINKIYTNFIFQINLLGHAFFEFSNLFECEKERVKQTCWPCSQRMKSNLHLKERIRPR